MDSFILARKRKQKRHRFQIGSQRMQFNVYIEQQQWSRKNSHSHSLRVDEPLSCAQTERKRNFSSIFSLVLWCFSLSLPHLFGVNRLLECSVLTSSLHSITLHVNIHALHISRNVSVHVNANLAASLLLYVRTRDFPHTRQFFHLQSNRHRFSRLWKINYWIS